MTVCTMWLLSIVHVALMPVATSHTYQSPMDGACRGPGGDTDKVNSRYVHEHSEADCTQDCDDEDHCVGYAYHPEANGGECIIYGPGMAGFCSVPTAESPAECAALGTCEDTTKSTESTCGSCSEVSAHDAATCGSVLGTWTSHVWTSAGAIWNDAPDPWTGEWHHSLIIKGAVAAAGYKCYEIDPSDHEAKCMGTSLCIAAFEGKSEELQIAANCPGGCTFRAAVAGAPSPKIPHAPALVLSGYTPRSGACRGPGNSKVNGKYSNTAGANGKLTERECADACNAEKMCVGYAHSTAWCVVYGPGIDETPGDKWTSDSHNSTSITGTKPNAAYICQQKSSPEQNNPIEVDGTTGWYLHSVLVFVPTLILSVVLKL